MSSPLHMFNAPLFFLRGSFAGMAFCQTQEPLCEGRSACSWPGLNCDPLTTDSRGSYEPRVNSIHLVYRGSGQYLECGEIVIWEYRAPPAAFVSS
jgi:hypothetical protein